MYLVNVFYFVGIKFPNFAPKPHFTEIEFKILMCAATTVQLFNLCDGVFFVCERGNVTVLS